MRGFVEIGDYPKDGIVYEIFRNGAAVHIKKENKEIPVINNKILSWAKPDFLCQLLS